MTDIYQGLDNNWMKNTAACASLLEAVFLVNPNKQWAKKRSPKLFDMGNKNEWLSSKEAAYYLGITPNAIRIMVCRGKVNFFKLGNRLRFRKSDLKSLLSNEGSYK